MIRREIKNFELVIGDKKIPVTLPFSMGDLAKDNNLSTSLLQSARLECEVFLHESSQSTRNIYFRLQGISHPCEIYVGERRLASLDGSATTVNLNAAGYVESGSNILSIRFTETDEGLLSAGIFEPLEMLRFSGAIINRVALTQTHGDGEVNIGIALDLIGNSGAVRAVATLVSPTGQIYYAGLTAGKGSITVKNPLYWWPRGFGVQNLYRLSVNLYGETDIEDSAELSIGLRTLSMPISNDNSIMVGNLLVLPMGAVYISDDNPYPTVLDAREHASVSAAAKTGYNCLLVPLDSPRPTENFYRYCDTHGIMIIEEHREPTEADLLLLAERSSHPSLVMVDLIGADDLEEAAASLREALPGVLIRPIDVAPEYVEAPAIPSMRSLRRYIPETERNLFAKSVESIAEDGAIQDMLLSVANKYPYPGDFSSFAYASALAAAHKVADAVREARLSEGKSGRAIFSHLADNRLTISSSAIDYRGRWKPLQYYTRRLFAPVKLYATSYGADVRFYGVNSRKALLSAVMEYRVLDRNNRVIYDGARQVELAAMSAGSLFGIDLSDYIEGYETERYLEYRLRDGDTLLSRDVMLFVPEKHFNFKKPSLKTSISGEGSSFYLVLSADCFVKDLEIDLDLTSFILSDNYIDLTSDAPVRVELTVIGGEAKPSEIKDALTLRSVSDLR